MKNRKPAHKKFKKNARRKIRKKKPAPKKRRQSDNFSCGISTPDTENINQALYIHKSERADGRGRGGSWKVVPKDSRELNRKRLRRNNKRRKNELHEENEENSAETPSDEESDKYSECQCSACKRRKKRRGNSSSSSRSSYSSSSSRR